MKALGALIGAHAYASIFKSFYPLYSGLILDQTDGCMGLVFFSKTVNVLILLHQQLIVSLKLLFRLT